MQTQFLSYKLSQKLGEGGMATVWYAENLLGKRFAIKVLKPGMEAKEKLAERFRLEAKMMVSLEHPSIRQVFDYHEDGTTMAIIMEYLEGEDLGRYLIEQGPVSESQAIQWFVSILDALAYVHAKNYIHRDLKPSNLFLTRDQQIKVMDFGIAKLVDSNLEMTDTNTHIGSPQYMSPEQITTPKAIDYRTDIYSLGVTLYALLTGRKPYDDSFGSSFTVQAEIVKKPLPWIPGVSERTNAVIQKATRKNPADRFQSCADMKDALTGLKPVEFDGNDQDEKTYVKADPNHPNLPPDVRNITEQPAPVDPPKTDAPHQTDVNRRDVVPKPRPLRKALLIATGVLLVGAVLAGLWVQNVRREIAKGVELAGKGEYTEAFHLIYENRESYFMTPEAMNYLGYMYGTGLGTQVDYTEALHWYRKAAEQGYLLSLSNIGVFYRDGLGVEKDYQMARDCFERAAAGGIARAKYNLGELYANGFGVSQNHYEAVRWYRDGAEDGDVGAQFKLGLAYQYGTGVNKDYSLAEYWYRKAARQNYADAQNSMGVLYYFGYIGGNGVDYATARFWYEKAATQNNVYSLYNLGYLYDYGQGVVRNWSVAVEYYKRAARLGNADAQKRLREYFIRW
ncbi:protein kinase domain-containing protein [Larkinella sp. VNQ87]|uniref:protein kinase domain-containing protein n=1 Tax=Larkinella sp. VNQ87 TaxID=3400921 RepID=UPI003C10BC05